MNPPILKGIKVHADNPFRFDFVLDQGDSTSAEAKQESTRLIKYFLASLTVPEKDLWVNLSPYEKDRIVPESFGQTEMGRDLLAQDYLLKQITASLIYPEDELGKKFWRRIYEEAQAKYGTSNIPVNTFNKVWIVPEKAVVYENAKAGTAYVVESRLKVMLEDDYLAQDKHVSSDPPVAGSGNNTQETAALGSQIVREIILPELTREINQGANFAQLRQVYNSLILATWYKKKIKSSILAQVYADKNKVVGVGYKNMVGAPLAGAQNIRAGASPAPTDIERIYNQYLQAFKKGVYNYIKEEPDPGTGQLMLKKYFSGGFSMAMLTPIMSADPAQLPQQLDHAQVVTTDFAVVSSDPMLVEKDQAMTRRTLVKGAAATGVVAAAGVWVWLANRSEWPVNFHFVFNSHEGLDEVQDVITAAANVPSDHKMILLIEAGTKLDDTLSFSRSRKSFSNAEMYEDNEAFLKADAEMFFNQDPGLKQRAQKYLDFFVDKKNTEGVQAEAYLPGSLRGTLLLGTKKYNPKVVFEDVTTEELFMTEAQNRFFKEAYNALIVEKNMEKYLQKIKRFSEAAYRSKELRDKRVADQLRSLAEEQKRRKEKATIIVWRGEFHYRTLADAIAGFGTKTKNVQVDLKRDFQKNPDYLTILEDLLIKHTKNGAYIPDFSKDEEGQLKSIFIEQIIAVPFTMGGSSVRLNRGLTAGFDRKKFRGIFNRLIQEGRFDSFMELIQNQPFGPQTHPFHVALYMREQLKKFDVTEKELDELFYKTIYEERDKDVRVQVETSQGFKELIIKKATDQAMISKRLMLIIGAALGIAGGGAYLALRNPTDPHKNIEYSVDVRKDAEYPVDLHFVFNSHEGTKEGQEPFDIIQKLPAGKKVVLFLEASNNLDHLPPLIDQIIADVQPLMIQSAKPGEEPAIYAFNRFVGFPPEISWAETQVRLKADQELFNKARGEDLLTNSEIKERVNIYVKFLRQIRINPYFNTESGTDFNRQIARGVKLTKPKVVKEDITADVILTFTARLRLLNEASDALIKFKDMTKFLSLMRKLSETSYLSQKLRDDIVANQLIYLSQDPDNKGASIIVVRGGHHATTLSGSMDEIRKKVRTLNVSLQKTIYQNPEEMGIEDSFIYERTHHPNASLSDDDLKRLFLELILSSDIVGPNDRVISLSNKAGQYYQKLKAILLRLSGQDMNAFLESIQTCPSVVEDYSPLLTAYIIENLKGWMTPEEFKGTFNLISYVDSGKTIRIDVKTPTGSEFIKFTKVADKAMVTLDETATELSIAGALEQLGEDFKNNQKRRKIARAIIKVISSKGAEVQWQDFNNIAGVSVAQLQQAFVLPGSKSEKKGGKTGWTRRQMIGTTAAAVGATAVGLGIRWWVTRPEYPMDFHFVFNSHAGIEAGQMIENAIKAVPADKKVVFFSEDFPTIEAFGQIIDYWKELALHSKGVLGTSGKPLLYEINLRLQLPEQSPLADTIAILDRDKRLILDSDAEALLNNGQIKERIRMAYYQYFLDKKAGMSLDKSSDPVSIRIKSALDSRNVKVIKEDVTLEAMLLEAAQRKFNIEAENALLQVGDFQEALRIYFEKTKKSLDLFYQLHRVRDDIVTKQLRRIGEDPENKGASIIVFRGEYHYFNLKKLTKEMDSKATSLKVTFQSDFEKHPQYMDGIHRTWMKPMIDGEYHREVTISEDDLKRFYFENRLAGFYSVGNQEIKLTKDIGGGLFNERLLTILSRMSGSQIDDLIKAVRGHPFESSVYPVTLTIYMLKQMEKQGFIKLSELQEMFNLVSYQDSPESMKFSVKLANGTTGAITTKKIDKAQLIEDEKEQKDQAMTAEDKTVLQPGISEKKIRKALGKIEDIKQEDIERLFQIVTGIVSSKLGVSLSWNDFKSVGARDLNRLKKVFELPSAAEFKKKDDEPVSPVRRRLIQIAAAGIGATAVGVLWWLKEGDKEYSVDFHFVFNSHAAAKDAQMTIDAIKQVPSGKKVILFMEDFRTLGSLQQAIDEFRIKVSREAHSKQELEIRLSKIDHDVQLIQSASAEALLNDVRIKERLKVYFPQVIKRKTEDQKTDGSTEFDITLSNFIKSRSIKVFYEDQTLEATLMQAASERYRQEADKIMLEGKGKDLSEYYKRMELYLECHYKANQLRDSMVVSQLQQISRNPENKNAVIVFQRGENHSLTMENDIEDLRLHSRGLIVSFESNYNKNPELMDLSHRIITRRLTQGKNILIDQDDLKRLFFEGFFAGSYTLINGEIFTLAKQKLIEEPLFHSNLYTILSRVSGVALDDFIKIIQNHPFINTKPLSMAVYCLKQMHIKGIITDDEYNNMFNLVSYTDKPDEVEYTLKKPNGSLRIFREAKKKDKAMSATGGIDLTSDKALQVKTDGQGEIAFHLDPAMLQKLQNSAGFEPIVIEMVPLTDLKAFLGVFS